MVAVVCPIWHCNHTVYRVGYAEVFTLIHWSLARTGFPQTGPRPLTGAMMRQPGSIDSVMLGETSRRTQGHPEVRL